MVRPKRSLSSDEVTIKEGLARYKVEEQITPQRIVSFTANSKDSYLKVLAKLLSFYKSMKHVEAQVDIAFYQILETMGWDIGAQ